MRHIILFVLLITIITACEEVIEVDLPETETRLVVNGIIRVDETLEFVPVAIKVAESSVFFEDNEIATLESAVIFYGTPDPVAPELLINGGFVSNLTELDPGSGIWVPDPNFDTEQRIRVSSINEGDVFQLILTQNDKRYFASTTYAKSVPIDVLEQGDDILFGGEETEIIVTFSDRVNTRDYYLIDFGFNEFLAVEDEFVDGQAFLFSYFYDREFEAGTELTVKLLGADQNLFNYMDLVLEQTQNTGGVFQTPVATVRGNVFDVTGLDNRDIFDNVQRPNDFALGYFAIVQEHKKTLIIE